MHRHGKRAPNIWSWTEKQADKIQETVIACYGPKECAHSM
uniref:Uncharacterized protein n=1 Tax=Rhizophora mucronata TaxID=61149 RepID=A0A2P2QAP0_RHIMU